MDIEQKNATVLLADGQIHVYAWEPGNASSMLRELSRQAAAHEHPITWQLAAMIGREIRDQSKQNNTGEVSVIEVAD